jgi:hypothetical protein
MNLALQDAAGNVPLILAALNLGNHERRTSRRTA